MYPFACASVRMFERQAKCEYIILVGAGRGLGGWGLVSVVCRLGHSGVRSRDRQLGFVTTVSPNCLVSNHWVFWVVYQRVVVFRVIIFRL